MFKNIKIVFFDFDDTLWIWKRNVENRNHEEILLKDLYKDSIYNEYSGNIPQKMVELVDDLIKNDIKVYCVSICNNSLEVSRKKVFLEKYYNKQLANNLIGVYSLEEKLNIYNAISKEFDVLHNECAVIDDNIQSLRNCKKDNYNVFSSLEIIVQ